MYLDDVVVNGSVVLTDPFNQQKKAEPATPRIDGPVTDGTLLLQVGSARRFYLKGFSGSVSATVAGNSAVCKSYSTSGGLIAVLSIPDVDVVISNYNEATAYDVVLTDGTNSITIKAKFLESEIGQPD